MSLALPEAGAKVEQGGRGDAEAEPEPETDGEDDKQN